MRNLPLLLVLLLGTGCASTLSTLQTAKPLEQGQFQVSLGAGYFVPVGQIATAAEIGIDQGKKINDAVQNDEPVELSEEDQRELFSAGIALAVAPPGAVNELMIRAGVVDNLDVGLRYSGISLRLDGKFRFLHRATHEGSSGAEVGSFDMALGVGVARHSFKSPVLDLLKIVDIDDFSRYDVEVPLYISSEAREIFKLYAAPKYVFSRTSLDQRLVDFSQQGKDVSGFDVSLPSRVNSHFVGSTFGAALGYKYVHLYAELTGGYTFCKTQVFGQEADIGGPTFYPVIGIAFRNGAPSEESRRARD
ncbi:hypothetical protein [Hyalangium rubrum]|uniref:Lipoprotein n=1 Tax=Hyalangium rubrum TaxID=3103134 RepID=A0ABU5HC04_9BACT|nr:hypothetical protein [Hyalangium sp. s54d21]MDY7230991.1 hypothetical protein [Hyalangium sp. s54d21]